MHLVRYFIMMSSKNHYKKVTIILKQNQNGPHSRRFRTYYMVPKSQENHVFFYNKREIKAKQIVSFLTKVLNLILTEFAFTNANSNFIKCD